MKINVTDLQRERLKAARVERHITQLGLSQMSCINMRTIQDLESGRRTSFTESTILPICKALDLDFKELLHLDCPTPTVAAEIIPLSNSQALVAIPDTKQKKKFTRKPILLVMGLLALGLGIFMLFETLVVHRVSGYARQDWIRPSDIGAFGIGGPEADPAAEGRQFLINYIDMKGLVRPNETVPVIFKWCWDYTKGHGRPVVYVNAFTEWDPDHENRLYDGVISGEGNDIRQFDFKCPSDPGKYRIRFFYAAAYAPIKSFFGSPEADQMQSPSSAPCAEMDIEVLPN
jgi:transcriptional regulator with XRE-family HTH domain